MRVFFYLSDRFKPSMWYTIFFFRMIFHDRTSMFIILCTEVCLSKFRMLSFLCQVFVFLIITVQILVNSFFVIFAIATESKLHAFTSEPFDLLFFPLIGLSNLGGIYQELNIIFIEQSFLKPQTDTTYWQITIEFNKF